MPQVKQTASRSLLEACIANVVENMDKVWCKHYVETYGKENKFYKYVAGPFGALPSKLLIQIIRILKEEKKLRRHHLELLITEQLNFLDLSHEMEDVAHPIRLASIRSPLRTLKLLGCNKISKQVYQDFLPMLNQLQVLDVSFTGAGDSCFFILGAYCKDLRELTATNCPITDAGIQGLCVNADDLGRPSDRLGQCKSINKLIISYTKVTSNGIQTAIENLPHLKVLECCSSVQVLAQMHLCAYQCQLPGLPTYPLIDLHCTTESFGDAYKSGSLAVAVALCPNVIKVRIVTEEDLMDDDLIALLALKQLRELSVGGGDSCNITFNGGVWPVLQILGHSLESLTLAELPEVNIRAIAEFCPNLRFLHLVMNSSYPTTWLEEERKPFSPRPVKADPVLKKLESIHLVCVSHLRLGSVIPSENLPMLLSSPELVHIYVKDCLTLSDDHLLKAFELHGFPRLEHLELEQCHSVTERGINLLINSANPLKTIKLWECRSLTRQNVINWTKQAKKKNWNLKLDWN